MPCYLFTHHAYGSWLPDRPQAYVRRGEDILPQDHVAAERYRRDMVEDAVVFAPEQQRTLIETLLRSAPLQRFECYSAATDATHIHALVGWRDARLPLKLRTVVKWSLSRGLNDRFERRTWLSEGGSRKRVSERGHFEHLVSSYLPKHRGWKWDGERRFYL